MPCVARPEPACGEQAVEVAVVGAGELEDQLAAGGGAREPHRGHRGLGARGGHAQHLDRLHPPHDLGRELDLAARSARRSSCRRAAAAATRREHLRVRVPVDQRPPRADVVDVAVAVDVEQLRALAALDEERVAPDRAHRAHRRVDAAGEHLEGASIELARACRR